MRIEISAGGIGSVSVMNFQSDMQTYMANAESVLSSFKTIQNSTCNLNGGIGNLQSALDELELRVASESAKIESAQRIQRKAEDFIQLAQRVDKQVAAAVNKNKDEMYRVAAWMRPSAAVDETPWYEDAWNWICGKGEQIADGLQKAWDWTKDTAKKAWDGLVAFYEEHWYDIINWGVTILCAVGSIVAIALIPVTGGASILLVAGVSALSSAIVAATRSITTQQRDKGKVDWGEVGKEAATAAIVGAITGAIGAGVGGAITSGLSNTGLGASLLSSSSTTVRVLTGAVIGSTSEVASGMLTRGAAEATESFLETGSVDFGDVWDAAADPQQMVLDAAIGGASGGFSSMQAPETSHADTTDWERTSNTASEEKILRELEADGKIDVFEVDSNLKDPVKQTSHLPKDSGKFTGEIGNSEFVPNDSKALAKMKEYGVDSVPYRNNDADFSAFTKHESPWGTLDGKVEIGHMTDQRTNGKWEFGKRPAGTSHDPAYDIGNFAQADNEVAKQFGDMGITGKDVEKYRKANNLTWHESADGKTMMLVPTEIHDACRHSGGVSEMKYRMEWGDITRPD